MSSSSEHSLGEKLPDVSAFTTEELEDMREGLLEAVEILGPVGAIPKEYSDTLTAITNELAERILLGN